MRAWLHHLYHYSAYLLGALVIAVCALALALRLWIMPDIARYKSDIEAAASRAVGLTVSIGEIRADWGRINPRFDLREVTLSQPGQPAPLRLPRVEATLSWLSLALLEPRLAHLRLERPALEVRRDAGGVIHVAGIPVNRPGSHSPFPDWLLRQHAVSVRDGRVVWRDELLGAPDLVLSQLDLDLFNRFGRHRFGLHAQPPADSIRRLDIRGDLRGRSVHDRGRWQGRTYLALTGASAEALRIWAPWAHSQVKRGSGDARLWLDLERGQPQDLVGDVRLADVAVSLANDRPDMAFRQVSGRVEWRREAAEHVLRVQGLKFLSATGLASSPGNVEVRLVPGPDGRPTAVRVVTAQLRLEALTALATAVPMPRPIHELIERLNPRGAIETADIAWKGGEHFRVKARFQDMGLNAVGGAPGFAGLDGEIDAEDGQGTARLSSANLYLDYPAVFRQPLVFAQMAARASWGGLPGGGRRIAVESLKLSNTDLDATAFGKVELRPGASPFLDIRAHLSRGNGNAVWRYLPHKISSGAYEWLKRGIVAGVSPDTRLVLHGPLDRFPYQNGGGEFTVAVKIQEGVLDYATNWPRIDGIHGWLVFRGHGMSLTAERGRIMDTRLDGVRVRIPDLHSSWDEMLYVEGRVTGATPAFFEFIRQSPVFDHTGRFTERLRASGGGELRLRLEIPVRHVVDTLVAGEYRIQDNRLEVGPGLPAVTGIDGILRFDRERLRGEGITARLLGLPVTVKVDSQPGGGLRVGLNGRLGADTLARWLPSGLSGRLAGTTPFQAEASMQARHAGLLLTSDLTGLAVRLPAPLGKGPEQARPLRLTLRDDEAGGGALEVRYAAGGASGGAALVAKVAGLGASQPRVGVYLGNGETEPPAEPGIVLRGNLPSLDLDAWSRLADAGEEGGTPLPLREVNLSLNQLRLAGRDFSDLNLRATPVPHGWRLQLAGRELAGEVQLDEPGGLPGKRLVGRFQRLEIPAAAASGDRTGGDSPLELPRLIQLEADAFSIAGRPLGSLDALMDAEHNGLRLRRFKIANSDGELRVDGWLSASPRRPTQVEIDLNTSRLGHLLTRLGYPEGIKGGEAHISGKLNWMGRPDDFQLASLGGHLAIQMKNGRFLKLDAGAGRLLGVFSLQSLPKRIILDFRDVFSEGYAFDSIEGEAHIERGSLYLPGLRINGPPAQVRMNGKVDMVAETQNLRLLIQPRLDEGAAVGAALLGGPVAGIGAFLASKLLRDPLAKAASFEYLVSGGWNDPSVTKLAKTQPAVESLP